MNNKMPDMDLDMYGNNKVSLSGYIKDGCLNITSEVYGDGDMFWDSEKHYTFTVEETNKLFSIISVDDFIELCRKERVLGMEKFFAENDIHPDECCI